MLPSFLCLIMKIYKNAISPQSCYDCIKEFRSNREKNVWSSSTLKWTSQLKSCITGECLSFYLSDELKEKVEDEIKEYLPEYESLTIQFFCWMPNSGISLHNDGGHKFGATIYLNSPWLAEWGGIFLWHENVNDSAGGLLSGLVPSVNTMVVNDSKQFHMVTPVSPRSPDLRLTLQIWGK